MFPQCLEPLRRLLCIKRLLAAKLAKIGEIPQVPAGMEKSFTVKRRRVFMLAFLPFQKHLYCEDRPP